MLDRGAGQIVYKKRQSGEMINTETLQHELEHKRHLNKIDDTSGDTKN